MVIAFAGVMLFAAALTGASSSSQPSQVARPLAPDQPVERPLASGEAHVYLIDLQAGQYLRVGVTQRGVNISLKLFGPEQQQLAQVNNENNVKGVETITLVAELRGSYRLEVLPLKQGPVRGQYLIKIEELRASTPEDRESVKAERASAEGALLEQMETAESKRKAIERYLEASRLYQSLGKRGEAAATLNTIGTVYRQLGEFDKALETYREALQISRAASDRRLEGATLNNMGLAHMQRGEYRKASESYDQAISLRRSVGDRAGEIITLQSISALHRTLGEYQNALKTNEEALRLSRMTGESEEIASSLNSLGMTLNSLEEYEKALEVFKEALQLYQRTGNLLGEATTLSGVGFTYNMLGEYGKALEAWQKSGGLLRVTESRRYEAYLLLFTALIHRKLGEYQKALDCLEQTLQIGRALGDYQMQAFALSNIGIVHVQRSEYQKAVDCFRQLIPLASFIPRNRRGQAALFSYAGIANGHLGRYVTAQYLFNRALQLSRSLGDHYWEVCALYGLALVERNRGNLKDARVQIEAALEIVESMRVKVTDSDLRSTYFGSTQDYYHFYIDLLMSMERGQPSEQHAGAALFASERSRARSLLEGLIEARAEIRQGVDPALLERERMLQQRLNAKATDLTLLLSENHASEQTDAAENEVGALITSYKEVRAQIRATSPHYAALTQPVPLSLKEIQQEVLDDETLLLEYSLGEERSFLWAVTVGSITSFELPGRKEIESAARQVYQLLTVSHTRQAKREAELAAAGLGQMLLGPVADQLEKRRLLIVADGSLQYIPFGALTKPQSGKAEKRESGGESGGQPIGNPQSFTPLIADHEIVSLPSASVLAVLRRELSSRKPASGLVAVLADPVLSSDDLRVREARFKMEKGTGALITSADDQRTTANSLTRSAKEAGVMSLERLIFTRREAEAILTLAHEGKTLKALDFDANRALAMSPELANYRIVHFATHGLINSQHPELSGLVLSLVDKQGRRQDGFLRAHDLYNLKLEADLVVLSACQTALGKQIKGEGLVGLVRGFMYAGAPRVVASLWDVKDEATAELMKRFYYKMLVEGMRPAAALRAAQVSMWKEPRWQAPYYWAGFMIQGEWK
jgi:CHAT domain-containing protein/tetratricopeptide (TPR) repeat protein